MRTWIPAIAAMLASACAGDGDGRDPVATTTSAADDGSTGEPIASSSGGDDGSSSGAPDDAAEIDAYLLGLDPVIIDDAQPKHEIDCDPNIYDCPAPWVEGDLTCTLVYYAETEQLDQFLAVQPDSPALWPGEIVSGAQMSSGFLSSIGLPRAPITFSISLENLDASPAATLDAPSLSAFRTARNAILAEGLHGATPAQLAYEIHTVESRSQLSILVGASVDWSGVVDLDALFDFDDGQFSNRFLFDFTQTYYTIDLDAPARPSDLFTPEVTLADVQLAAPAGDPPMYVQSVAYGRRVLFALESDASLETIVAAVDAALGGVVEIEGDVDAQDTLNAAKITAAVLGGDGEAAVATILGVEELMTYITEGGNYSADSPGAPIAYKLAYLDNGGVRLSLTAVYPETHCE